MSKAFKFRGKHYDNLNDFVRKHNLEREEFIRRIRAGESLAVIVDTMGSKVTSNTSDEKYGKIKVGKKQFKNLKVACLSLGADVDIVEQFMDMGLSADNAFVAFFEKEKPVVNNEPFESIGDLARKYDVGEKKLLQARLENASYEEALLSLGVFGFINQHKLGAKALVNNVKRTFQHEDNTTTEKLKTAKEVVTGTALVSSYEESPKVPAPAIENQQSRISSDIFARD